MLNRKINLMVILSCLGCMVGRAQSGAWTAGAGYSMYLIRGDMHLNTQQTATPERKGSYGQGFHLRTGADTQLKSGYRLGADLEFSYSQDYDGMTFISLTGSVSNTHARGVAWLLSPYIYREYETSKNYRLFAQAGLLTGSTRVNYRYASHTYLGHLVMEQQLRHKLALGVKFSGGVIFDAGAHNWSTFLSAELAYFQPRQKEIVITKYFRNGTDQLSSLRPSEKTVPKDERTTFSSIGFKAGVRKIIGRG